MVLAIDPERSRNVKKLNIWKCLTVIMPVPRANRAVRL